MIGLKKKSPLFFNNKKRDLLIFLFQIILYSKCLEFFLKKISLEPHLFIIFKTFSYLYSASLNTLNFYIKQWQKRHINHFEKFLKNKLFKTQPKKGNVFKETLLIAYLKSPKASPYEYSPKLVNSRIEQFEQHVYSFFFIVFFLF